MDQRPLRIGYSLFNGVFEAVPVMQRAVAEAKELLEASGHQVHNFYILEDFGDHGGSTRPTRFNGL